MKKIRNFIKKLSLTQQLILIVVSITAFLIVFFFGFLSLNIDRFVNTQMFRIIHNAQDDIIENYLLGKTGPSLFGSSDASTLHIISIRNGVPLVSADLETSEISDDIFNQINNIQEAVEYTNRYDGRFGNNLIAIKNINQEATIATVMSVQYHNEFKSTLLNSFVYMVMMVIGVVFILLLFWVGTIIHPLNQIRYYIEKSKRGVKATLKVERGDEIGELANVLLEMQEEIKRQEEQKEEMLQNISHDLKTPVATIKSYSEAIKDGIYPYETLEKSVDVILEHANRLEKKVYNLLMLNRMDYMTTQQLDQTDEIVLDQSIEQVIVSTRQIRPEIEIKLDIDGSHFVGQEEPWRVVIENLLDNALRYSVSEVVITVRDHSISIFNDGKRIPEKRLRQLFKPYEMGEKGQFGLGLAIVNRVVTNYGYTVRAENKKTGVMFIIEKGV